MDTRGLAALAALVAALGCGTAEPAPAAGASPASVAPLESADPWARVRPGATFVQRAVMVTRPPMVAHESEARYVTRVLAVDADSVTLGVTVDMAGGARGGEEQHRVSRRDPVGPLGLTWEPATIEVPAGTFACRYVRERAADALGEWTTEAWYDPAFPLPYKLVVTGPRSTTIELESFELE